MSSNNIVQFPNAKKSHPPQSMEEVIERVENSREELAEHAMSNVLGIIYDEMIKFGIDLDEEHLLVDRVFVFESVRSLVKKALDLDHMFQELAELTIDITSIDEEDGLLSYVTSLPFVFTLDEDDEEPEEIKE